MISTVLIAGGTGMIGARLTKLLRSKGYTVRILSRSPRGAEQFRWDPATGEIDARALEGVQAVINLAGEGIADGRWTAERKRRIYSSRIDSTRTLREAIAAAAQKPLAYVSASAIGIYGDSGEKWMEENDPPANPGFMPEVCAAWEQAAMEVKDLGIRTVLLRIGIVLAPEGGALKPIALPTNFGVAPYFGDGRAWWSWIHATDLCRMFQWAVENADAKGVYNAVAPHPVRNKQFVQAVAHSRGKWGIPVPAPAFGLRLVFGEMSATILNSNRVSAEKIVAAGFEFEFPEIKTALTDLYG